MFIILEIIIITLAFIGAITYFIWNLRKELKGSCACGNICDSCKIKENCIEPELLNKTINKSK